MLYKFVVSAFESIVDIKLYSDFYAHLETEINEKWYWDQESQSKAQGLFSSCRRFDRLVAFDVLFNGLEPLKPLVAKLQKRNLDIYHAYYMINKVIRDLKDIKRDIENEFKGWFKFATDMASSVGVDPEKPRTAKCWSHFKDNVLSTDYESYYRQSIVIPVMDSLINNLEDRIADRKHTEIFSLLPSVCLSEHFNLDTSAEELIKHFGDDLQYKMPTIFRSELKRWVKNEMEN